MNRRTRLPSHVAACLLAALLAAVAVRAAGARYQERRRAFEEQAEARRKKLGLDGDRVKLFARYPTPEVQFGEGVLQLSPGATGTVRVSGAFPEGTQFLLASDDVAVLKETSLNGSWEAQVKLAAAALPGEVVLHVTAPVSLAESAQTVISVRGQYALELSMEDGTQASFRPEQQDDGTLLGTVSFKAKGEKAPSRTRKATLGTGSPLVLEVMPSEEDVKLASEGMKAGLAVLQDPGYQKQQEALARKIEACAKGTPASMAACMEPAAKELQALQASVTAKAEAIAAAQKKKLPKGGLACTRWTLSGAAGKVEGTAACDDEQELKVTGTIRVVP